MIKNFSDLKTVLLVGGVDPTGLSGLAADIRALSSLKIFSAPIACILTSQDSSSVSGITSVDPVFFKKQLQCAFKEIRIDALKTGALGNADLINTLANQITKFQLKNVVVDPVFKSTSGGVLTQETANNAYKKLFKLSTIVTPTIQEAQILLGTDILTLKDAIKASKAFLTFGCQSVYLKCGELDLKYNFDIYLDNKGKRSVFRSRRIPSPNLRGTGCAFASALAGALATGMDSYQATIFARNYIKSSIKKAQNVKITKGSGPIAWR